MEKINISYAGSGINPSDLSFEDSELVSSNYIPSEFGYERDVIEIHIYGENGQLLLSDYDGKDFYPDILNNPKNNTYSSLLLDPEKDLKARGFNRGQLTIQYNFLNNLFNSSEARKYWIKEISRSRTEIRLSSQVLSASEVIGGLEAYNSIARTQNYFPIFYLNFGNNNFVVANNAATVTNGDFSGDLIIKLYEPLPADYTLKTQLWIVRKIAESVSYDVSIEVEAEVVDTRDFLRGPNYKVVLNTKNGQTTPYYNYNSLLISPVSSSSQKLSSWYQDKAISINVDYSNFSNFVHFSSATERVNNFYYKLQLIENAQANIVSQSAIIGGDSSAINSSISAEQQIIDNVIKNFDTYEYFLYFESSSWAWPKRTSTQPYQLYSVTSSQASNFLGSTTTIPTATTQSLLWSASYYDSTNKDVLRNSLPQYLLDDPSNEPGLIFLDMLGQHFDNVWIYYKDVTNRYNATNNPNTGVSLDLVSDALKGLGFNLYTNTNVSDNLYYTLFGINPDGSLLPPTGSEKITAIGGKYVTSSLATLPAQTLQDEVYKRLYHNLPYLYKTKGTLQSIKALISIYGIPESILSVKEFGGNFTGSLNGVFDVNSSDYKVQIVTGSGGNVTGSLTISSSLLSPYTTIQYSKDTDRLNTAVIEVGFSPSDVVNSNISSSQGLIRFDQLIGSPAYMYSASYTPLVSASNAYFATYTQRNSVWEYMRLLKFYNNSLFKTIKDFVPARSSVSTGIIIKSHLYERNKYARHEPSMSISIYSQSIDILDFSAEEGGALTDSTSWSSNIVTPYGLASYTSSNGIEKYTGELSGSVIDTYVAIPFDQTEVSTGQTSSYYPSINLGALYQNITGSVRSRYLIDLDYSTNINTPINYNAVTYSLSQSRVNSYNAYTNKNNPFAEVQDYNYNLIRSVYPRYIGSKVESLEYNTYSPITDAPNITGSVIFDAKSYGKQAAIDKIKPYYAYVVNVFSASFQMPNRAKAQIKYLINNDQNVLNLSKNNNYIFEVQNTFKAGEWADLSLFNYDPTNPYIQKINNSEKDFTIYESGYSYSPLIYANSSSAGLTYVLDEPITQTSTGTSAVYTQIFSGNSNYWSNWSAKAFSPYVGAYLLSVTSSNVGGGGDTVSSAAVYITYYVTNNTAGRSPSTYPQTAGTYATITIANGTAEPYANTVWLGGGYSSWQPTDSYTVTIIKEETFTTATIGTTTVISASTETLPNTYWRISNKGNEVILSPTQSFYYGEFSSTGSYEGLDRFVYSFDLSPGDMIRFYNHSSSRWDQGGEFRVISVGSVASGSIIGGTTGLAYNAVSLTLDRNVPVEYATSGSSYPLIMYRYIALKKLVDETSIYFNYNLGAPITSDGIIFPQYVGEGVRDESGNTIKSLKQQNLI